MGFANGGRHNSRWRPRGDEGMAVAPGVGRELRQSGPESALQREYLTSSSGGPRVQSQGCDESLGVTDRSYLLADLEDFLDGHRLHGTLVAEATEPAWNGYLLSPWRAHAAWCSSGG